jgi:adenylate cyclase
MEKMETQQVSRSTGKKEYWIEFIGDRSVKIQEGQTILDASLHAGIPHYHACGGNGQCSTCRVHIQNGGENLSPPTPRELLLKKRLHLPDNIRLACQTKVMGTPVALHRIIRDEMDRYLYVDENNKDDLLHLGQEREMALFFLDIRNFTPFMESLMPFDVIHIMRRLFQLFQKNIEAYQGKIIDTAGDGFYAVFGFETTIQRAANQAFSSARAIQLDLEDFNNLYAEKHFLHRFQVGIGLHAGSVITGNIGIGVNNNLTVMGLPVNIASRIQGITKALNNNLITSEQFYRLLSPPPPSQITETTLKGIKGTFVLHLCGQPYDTPRP